MLAEVPSAKEQLQAALSKVQLPVLCTVRLIGSFPLYSCRSCGVRRKA